MLLPTTTAPTGNLAQLPRLWQSLSSLDSFGLGVPSEPLTGHKAQSMELVLLFFTCHLSLYFTSVSQKKAPKGYLFRILYAKTCSSLGIQEKSSMPLTLWRLTI